MAGRRTTRADLPTDPAGVVRALRVCRGAMIEVCSTVRPTGPCYHAASMVIAAIDGFAVFLTGQRHYFSAIGGGAPADQVAVERAKEARERGDEPWE